MSQIKIVYVTLLRLCYKSVGVKFVIQMQFNPSVDAKSSLFAHNIYAYICNIYTSYQESING